MDNFFSTLSLGQVRDVNNREVFKNHELCAEFLRDYTDLDLLKNITADDIEDVTEKYQAYLGIEFETDTIKRVRLPSHLQPNDSELPNNYISQENASENIPLFVISLIEHKSNVDYNVSMQLLRYIACIWDDYAKTARKQSVGDSRNLNFRYPPILPIVYYEGTAKWTAPMQLKDRIFLNEVFAPYIPDFTYRLVNVHNYSNDELLSTGDAMSFLMMINRIQTPEDFSEFIRSNQDAMKEIVAHASNDIIQIIINALWSLFMKMQVPTNEATSCIKKVVGGGTMGNWFENMEPMDIQAERHATQEAKAKLADVEAKLENMESALSNTQSALSNTQQLLKQSEEKYQNMQRLSDKKIRQLEEELEKLRAQTPNK